MTSGIELTTDDVQTFADGLSGGVTGQKDANYDEVRALYNAMIDKRPALIARCASTDDVVAAVNFGRDHGLDIAIRCGGHNGPGLGSGDDGLVLADGSVVTADETTNDDLYWAIRGGGGNFGVVTSLTMRLHPIGTVVAGPMIWSLDAAGDLLRWYRDFILDAPEDLNGFFAFGT